MKIQQAITKEDIDVLIDEMLDGFNEISRIRQSCRSIYKDLFQVSMDLMDRRKSSKKKVNKRRRKKLAK